MNEILAELLFWFVYIGGILVFRKLRRIEYHLQQVFQKPDEYGLTLNTSKCIFGVPEISFLGYTISSSSTKPLPDWVQGVLNFPLPESIRERPKFLGFINFYRRHLPHVASNQASLHEFLMGATKNDKRKVEWLIPLVRFF